ncbi:MAG: LysM peptidoglycan-binding domain-containing protein [Janthinobacterium lividum]
MKKLLPALLLGLAGRSGLAAAPPTVPAAIDAMGLHLVLDSEARQLIQAKVNSLCRHKTSLEARIALAESAFPLIDQVLAQEGVPADFRYLVLQESALQGNAESVHGAVGYWQFKRETALDYGLTVNGSIDERRHLTASTRAAARYLARNNASLHNWANTLLSYNLGLGGVRPYVQPNDPDASQMAITANSSIYILDFLAQKVVFEPACAQHTVAFVPWREVPATPGLSLAQQAAALSADPAAVARLNPWLLARTVPQNGRTYTLLLPLPDAAPLAASPVLASPTPVRPGNAEYLRINGLRALAAQPGDTPAALAARGGASLGFFLKVNELVANERLIPGAPYFFERKREEAEQEYHVVRPGQTLTAVAQHFGVLRRVLLVYNHLQPGEPVRPGLVLWLSHVRPRNIAAEYQSYPGSRPVVVQRLVAPTPPPIDEEEEETAEELATINELPTEVPGPPVLTLPSRTLTVPVSVPVGRPVVVAPVVMAERPTYSRPAPRAVTPVVGAWQPSGTYTVAPHETLYALARRLGVRPAELAAWNSLLPTAALRVGQVLRLSAPTQSLQASGPRTSTYTVASGDTFFSLSQRYNCTVAELQASNGKAESTLHVGETIRIPTH